MDTAEEAKPGPIPVAMTGMADMIETKSAEDQWLVLRRSAILALIAFLTLVDLFGTQALLPFLVEAHGVSLSAMGFAVNASTIGMAAASLAVAVFARRIDRKRGIWLSLALLSVPTLLLGFTDDLTLFAILRIVQGVFMATAFTLTLTYLSEECVVTAVGGAMAAYVTGNVASNLFGRLMASGAVDTVGLDGSFVLFAALNLVGAAIAYLYIGRTSGPRPASSGPPTPILRAWGAHFADPRLRTMFAAGFLLLFVFVATFTYANFAIVEEPLNLPQASVGLVYLVFLPAILTTPVAAGAVSRYGARRSFLAAMVTAAAGLALLATASLALVLLGLAMVGAGLFFAQSVATAYVGRTAQRDHAAANGLYLASYYLGGIAGALVMGLLYEAFGWSATVAVLLALTAAGGLFARTMDH